MAGPSREMGEMLDDAGCSSPPFRPHKLLALCSYHHVCSRTRSGEADPSIFESRQQGEIQTTMMLGHVSDKAFLRGDISQLVHISIRHTLPITSASAGQHPMGGPG